MSNNYYSGFDMNGVEPGFMSRIQTPSPAELMATLNKEVVGQDKAKKVLSIAIANHFKRVMAEKYNACTDKSLKKVRIEKSNVLILGDSGTGKTHMIKTIAKTLNMPCYIGDATKLTESGYVGDDVETILTGLLIDAKYDVGRAETGIVCIDEIDKLSKRNAGASITRDVGGEGVQQSLLKIVEGSVIGVPPNGGRKHPEQQLIQVDTSHILFIGMGAFDGIENVISSRLNFKTIGFNTTTSESADDGRSVISHVNHDDLIQYGMIPELAGRFPVLANTESLTVDDLCRILTEPQSSLVNQYKKLLSIDGIKLVVEDDAVKAIAEHAASKRTGARSLRGVMEEVLMDVMFNPSIAENGMYVVSEKMVNDCLKEVAAA